MENQVEFSKDQLKAIEAVKQKKNVFITGSAGVGKSFVLGEILKILPKHHTYVTASTGVAACNIGGITLYSFAGIGLGTESVQTLTEKILRWKKPARQRWQSCKCLIIDEISMISGELFNKVETIARTIRGVDKPFGGIQLILCGDFFQLPPVNQHGENSLFCFETAAWQQCIDITVALRQVFRQKDEFFVQLLNRVRYGNIRDEDVVVLKKCKDTVFDTKDGIKPTKLFPHRASCNNTNELELSKLPGPTQRYESIDDGREEYMQQLDRHSRYVKVLELRVGAQVMLLTNLSVASGLVNGARGVIVSFVSDKEYAHKSENLEYDEDLDDMFAFKYPLVRFANGSEVLLQREMSTIEIAGKVVASRFQIPLALAWAVSIHKSQGITLERCEMSLKNVFAPGQAYVALSRVTKLEGLMIRDINPKMIHAHPKVKQYYEGLGFKDSDVKFCPLPSRNADSKTKGTHQADSLSVSKANPVLPKATCDKTRASTQGTSSIPVIEIPDDESEAKTPASNKCMETSATVLPTEVRFLEKIVSYEKTVDLTKAEYTYFTSNTFNGVIDVSCVKTTSSDAPNLAQSSMKQTIPKPAKISKKLSFDQDHETKSRYNTTKPNSTPKSHSSTSRKKSRADVRDHIDQPDILFQGSLDLGGEEVVFNEPFEVATMPEGWIETPPGDKHRNILEEFKKKVDGLYFDHCYCKMDPVHTSFGQPFSIKLTEPKPIIPAVKNQNKTKTCSFSKANETKKTNANKNKPYKPRAPSKKKTQSFLQPSRSNLGTTCAPTPSSSSYPTTQKALLIQPNQLLLPSAPFMFLGGNGQPTNMAPILIPASQIRFSDGTGILNLPVGTALNLVSSPVVHSNGPSGKENSGLVQSGSTLTPEQRRRSEESRLRALQRRDEAIRRNSSQTFLTGFS